MAANRWIKIASYLTVAGGIAWLAKIMVIVATDGRVTDTGLAALFLRLGFALLLVGSTGLGLRFALARAAGIRLAAVILSPLAFLASFALLDAIFRNLVGGAAASYWRDEAGILATAVVWLLIGLALVRSVGNINHRTAYGA